MLSVHRLITSSCSIASMARATATWKGAGETSGKRLLAVSADMPPRVFPTVSRI